MNKSSSILERTPPNNIEAEMGVLGSMLISRDAIGTAVEKGIGSSFYSEAHNKLFHYIVSLYDENKPVDILTLTERLKNHNELDSVGGASYIAVLSTYVPTAANIEHYIKIIQGKYVLRQLIDAGSKVISQCYDSPEEVEAVLDSAERMVFEITQYRIKDNFISFRDLIKDSIETVEQLYQNKKLVIGISTGFKDFDQKTSGLQNSNLIVIAARPSMGKTSFAMNIAEHTALENKIPVAIFSLEMSKEQLALRMLCSHSRVDIHRMRTGFLGETDFPRLVAAAGKLANAPIFIDDTPSISIMELKAKARRLKSKYDIRLLILDYLQLMQSVTKRLENRQQEIAMISRSLKGLARELDIPIIVISQLNRAVESRPEHIPQLSDLRESGAIEQDADVVALMLRREYYDPEDSPGIADLILAKQRNGPTGRMKLRFFSEFTRFEDYTEEEVPSGI